MYNKGLVGIFTEFRISEHKEGSEKVSLEYRKSGIEEEVLALLKIRLTSGVSPRPLFTLSSTFTGRLTGLKHCNALSN